MMNPLLITSRPLAKPGRQWPGVRAVLQGIMALLMVVGIIARTSVAAQNTPSDPCVTSGATNQFTVGATCTPVTFNKPNGWAANLTPAGSTCNSGAFSDAFGWFQATSTSTTITYAPNAQDVILHVFSGTCAAPVQVACADVGLAGVAETVTFTTTVGTSYFFRVQRWNANTAMNGTICVYNTPPPPANNDPCGATVLSVTTSCSAVSATNSFATASTGPPAPTCASYAGNDVWFRLVVPASGSVIIETFAGAGITDGGMAVYTAPNCSGTFVQEYCDDDGMPGASFMPYLSLTGLAPTTTIWVRFWAWGNEEAGTFTICAHTPPPPPTGDCVYVLNLFDSWGDGWGSSNVGVRINGGTWTYYTVGGSNNQILIGMMIGDFIELSYDASGPFQGENSYSLGILGGGNYFNSGATPAAGASFGHLVDCQPPPAAPQDCAGGFTVCSGQAFNNNSSNTGNIVDLNSANRGCLSLGERQGTWYYFSPSANGTLAFTIAPTVATTDYDFAVWGPMSSVTCPPPSAPARCSYAGSTGNTGLGNGATDTSEDALGDRWVSPMPVTTGQVYLLYVDNFSSNGQAFNLNWQLSGGASLDCSLLPIELINAAAEAVGRSIIITWTTLTEEHSDRFIVERSMDGSHFEPIGSVAAAGHSSAAIDYRLEDGTPGTGTKYYRINMVDSDGLSILSPVISATIDRWSNNVILAPNPVSDLLNITFREAPGQDIEIRIVDAAGRTVRSVRMTLLDGAMLATVPTQGLDAGSYTLSALGRDGTPLAFAPFVRE